MSSQYLPRIVAFVWIASTGLYATGHAEVAPPDELDASGVRLANMAFSVGDIERSLRFYEALGFEVSGSRYISPLVAKTLEVQGELKARLAFIRRNGVVVELVEVQQPRVEQLASKGLAFQLGMAHFTLRVDSVDRVAAIVRANGGSVLEDTRTKMQGREFIFCADPDGVRFELAYIDPAVVEATHAPPRGQHQKPNSASR